MRVPWLLWITNRKSLVSDQSMSLLVTLKSGMLLLLLLLSAVTHAPFHAPVLRPTSWPNARDRRDGEVN